MKTKEFGPPGVRVPGGPFGSAAEEVSISFPREFYLNMILQFSENESGKIVTIPENKLK